MVFVKVRAPLDVLYQKAEDMNIQMPIKNSKKTNKNSGKTFFKNFYDKYEHLDPFIVNKPTVRRRNPSTTTTFSTANVAAFESKNGPYFFDNAERSRMVRRILQLTSFTRRETSEEVEEHEDDTSLEEGHGIEQLCHNGIYQSYYPLHDGPLQSPDNHEMSHENHNVPCANGNIPQDSHMTSNDDYIDNDRQRLRKDWASFSMIFKYQPLDAIRDYFGVRVSFYFAWLGVYTTFLVPAAIVGSLCFLYALGTMMTSEPLKEICDQSNER